MASTMANPPSTSMVDPVTKEASSLARKTQAAAISFGEDGRRKGNAFRDQVEYLFHVAARGLCYSGHAGFEKTGADRPGADGVATHI